LKIKRGDIVGRKSYGKDILFIVDRFIKLNNKKEYAILKGMTIRIEADAPIEDLQLIDDNRINNITKSIENKLLKRIDEYNKEKRYKGDIVVKTGRILHLDGDRRYSEKSAKYYQKLGLDAIVKNIPENKQPKMVRRLLDKYKPDILIITGHDAMLKRGSNFCNIYNYRNSRHFINTVIEARKWSPSSEKLAIFAGACQSFFEAIMEAGADFASSPGRILIDFIDPLIVAEKIALTDNYKFVSIYEISKEIRDGEKGISGIGAKGKKRVIKKLY